jgi:predicted transcriptional regulator
MVNRSRDHIVADILEVAKDKSITFTELMRHANLSYVQAKKYILSAAEVGLLSKIPISDGAGGAEFVYITTEDKGKRFLENSAYTLGILDEMEKATSKINKPKSVRTS